MPSSTPSPTRERIMDATLELVLERGFGGTAVTDIEAAAGLSPGSGSFYRHFRSKREVFEAVFERELDRARRHRTGFERGPVGGAAEAALTRRLLEQLDYLAAIRPLIMLLAREHGRFPELTARVREALLDGGIADEAAHLARDLDGAPGDEPLRDDPHAVTAVVVSALTGYHLSREFFGRPPAGVAPERFAAALAALLAARND
ncbi:TetR family transcriptional regulator [Actinomadura sp. NBRC 104425]|uniref:TetR/AcrR family transcriptional regulator n=1 Tax=Actinomadura sp. NBRC 104425 TaxID=3032204 RepID=UPI0024A5D1F9|nr:TetR/AcrR family transcriptional regulator [Actinomadura sp. NBRC 104425]GLZ15699.1 TetR family transcriptional regulator [Actinomadura sp. NBRC 104425]